MEVKKRIKQEGIFLTYNVNQPYSNRYKINLNNPIIRVLTEIFRKENNISYYDGFSDLERGEFERIILRSDIKENDSIASAIEKYYKAKTSLQNRITSEMINEVRNKILKGEKI